MGGDVAHHYRCDADYDQRNFGRFPKPQRDEQDGQQRNWRDHRDAGHQRAEGGAHWRENAEHKSDRQRDQSRYAKAEAETLEACSGIGPEHELPAEQVRLEQQRIHRFGHAVRQRQDLVHRVRRVPLRSGNQIADDKDQDRQ